LGSGSVAVPNPPPASLIAGVSFLRSLSAPFRRPFPDPRLSPSPAGRPKTGWRARPPKPTHDARFLLRTVWTFWTQKRGIYSGAHEGRGEEAGRSHPLLMPPPPQRDVARYGWLSHSRGRPSVDGAPTDRRDTPGDRERGSEREKGCPLKGGEVVALAPGKEATG